MGRKAIEEVTEKQREILELLIQMTMENGYQPSRADLAMATGTTRHAVSVKIQHLVNKGFLKVVDGGGERCLRILGVKFLPVRNNDVLQDDSEKVLGEILSSKGVVR